MLETLLLDSPKTGEMERVLNALDVGPSTILVADGADQSVLRAARNIPRLKMLPASLLNTLDLTRHRKVVMTVEAVRKAEELWGGGPLRLKKHPVPAAEQA